MKRSQLGPGTSETLESGGNEQGPPVIVSEDRLRRLIMRFLLKAVAIAAIVVALFLGIAFLPGSIEGNYRGSIVSSCGCNSINFLNFRSQRMVQYSTAHPNAAFLMGRYEPASEGVTNVFLDRSDSGENDTFLFRAHPRFLFTRFESISESKFYWCWKWPLFGETRKAVDTHEVRSFRRLADHVETIIYDREFRVVRTETKDIKMPKGPPDGK